MSKGVNKVILVATLGADPETRYTATGAAITGVRAATNESWKDKQGEQQERTEWHSVTFFGRLAEIAGEYLRKGSQVYIEGRLQTDKWQDKDGNDRYTTKIIANEMQMLGGKSEQPQRTKPEPSFRERGAPPPMDSGFANDDIPFSQEAA